ncbi:hypothetical protein FPQ18DRAFT_383726 [Pyronema domesticum]|nr:hypothetical protein FPQ18DRAFT_383726 [Pyronema domesticum]
MATTLRPSPGGASSAIMDDVQDVLTAVRNPPKRKRASSGHQEEPTTPTQRRPAVHKPRASSSEDSLMHSVHVTSAAQAAADTQKQHLAPPTRLPTKSDDTISTSLAVSETQDTTLHDTPATAPAGDKGWMIVEGKVSRRRRTKGRNDKESVPVGLETSSGIKGQMQELCHDGGRRTTHPATMSGV